MTRSYSERTVLDALLLHDRDIRSLFDLAEIDHVCDLVRDSPGPLAGGLQTYTVEPLERIIERLEARTDFRRAAIDLHSFLETIVRLIRLRPESASEFSVTLRTMWIEFVVTASASRLSIDVPRARAQKRTAARHKRPASMSKIAAAIREVMRPYRGDEIEFKNFISAWEREPLGGLRLTADETDMRYTVDDENGDVGTASYTWGSLSKMYSS